mmetsp:Transcript_4215/g.17902  ORF Transcript_4215/g.17902 Transcript_4215/m.17902 type:complete len:327 (-) Transcript_4215:392-1372(-)
MYSCLLFTVLGTPHRDEGRGASARGSRSAVDGLRLLGRRRRRALVARRLRARALGDHLGFAPRGLFVARALALSLLLLLRLAFLHHLADAFLSLLRLARALQLALARSLLLLPARLLGEQVLTLHRAQLRRLADVDEHRLRRALARARQERLRGSRAAASRRRVAQKRRAGLARRRCEHRRRRARGGRAARGVRGRSARGEVGVTAGVREAALVRAHRGKPALGLAARAEREVRVRRRRVGRRRARRGEQAGRQVRFLERSEGVRRALCLNLASDGRESVRNRRHVLLKLSQVESFLQPPQRASDEAHPLVLVVHGEIHEHTNVLA